MTETKAEYWRCQNDECGFFVKRRKKYPYNQKGKRWEDKSRWLIANGVIDMPENVAELLKNNDIDWYPWVKLRCPQCSYNVVPGSKQDVVLDTQPISIIESFKKSVKKSAD